MKKTKSAIGTTNQTVETQTGIQIFDNSQFGQMRVRTSTNGKVWFCLADVCKALEIGYEEANRKGAEFQNKLEAERKEGKL